jgi:hypothetical protein
MKKIVLLAICCSLLQGCVGGIVLKPRTEIINHPAIDDYAGDADAAHKKDSAEATNGVVYTSAWLQAHWGSPRHVRHTPGGADEVWIYHFRPIWVGVVPCVILPIPVALPVVREKTCFTIHDGHVVSASVTMPWEVGGVAGVLMSPEGGGSFGAVSLNDEAAN